MPRNPGEEFFETVQRGGERVLNAVDSGIKTGLDTTHSSLGKAASEAGSMIGEVASIFYPSNSQENKKN
jgi:hypothetical protein